MAEKGMCHAAVGARNGQGATGELRLRNCGGAIIAGDMFT